jgi:hypothetical protein
MPSSMKKRLPILRVPPACRATTEGGCCALNGAVRNREIFEPLRLHYGLFGSGPESRYLIARENGPSLATSASF